MRGKPKSYPPFARKLSKSETIEALAYKFLKFEEDIISEDDAATKDPIEEDASILVNSETATNYSQADIHNLMSIIRKKKSSFKTKVNKYSTYAK